MENMYLPIDYAKIRYNLKRTKTSRNEEMHTTSDNHSYLIFPKPCPQPDRCWQASYRQKRLYLLGHFENGFHFLSIKKGS